MGESILLKELRDSRDNWMVPARLPSARSQKLSYTNQGIARRQRGLRCRRVLRRWFHLHRWCDSPVRMPRPDSLPRNSGRCAGSTPMGLKI